MYTITVEYMDGKTVRFKDYDEYEVSESGHILTIKNGSGFHIIPLLNVRDVHVEE